MKTLLLLGLEIYCGMPFQQLRTTSVTEMKPLRNCNPELATFGGIV
jgi:hypothetical protein